MAKQIANTQYSEWEITFPDEQQILICGPGKLEILIKDFDPNLTEKNQLLDDIINTFSASYWIEKPTEYTNDAVCLDVITVSAPDTETKQATLHIGTQVSLELPFEFACHLQSVLLGNTTNI